MRRELGGSGIGGDLRPDGFMRVCERRSQEWATQRSLHPIGCQADTLPRNPCTLPSATAAPSRRNLCIPPCTWCTPGRKHS